MIDLSLFFNHSLDNDLNESLLSKNTVIQKEKILSYVNNIISVPIPKFLEWIRSNRFVIIESKDMLQISKFEDAFYNIVIKLKNEGDPGVRFVEIGKLLQNDGKDRNDGANRKYGENHAKTAEYLGYLFSKKYFYFVSCFGYALDFLSEEEKTNLFIRLLLRTNLFRIVYLSSLNDKVKLRSIFDFLSEKTYKRRLNGTREILFKLKLCNDYDFNNILDCIEF